MFNTEWQLYVYQRREQLEMVHRFHLLKQIRVPLHRRIATRLGEALVTVGSQLQARSEIESEAVCMTTPWPQATSGSTTK